MEKQLIIDVVSRSERIEDYTPKPVDPAVEWNALQNEAISLLTKSDITIIRYTENGEAVPPQWIVYRNELRNIVSSQSIIEGQTIPERPSY